MARLLIETSMNLFTLSKVTISSARQQHDYEYEILVPYLARLKLVLVLVLVLESKAL